MSGAKTAWSIASNEGYSTFPCQYFCSLVQLRMDAHLLDLVALLGQVGKDSLEQGMKLIMIPRFLGDSPIAEVDGQDPTDM